MSRLLGFYLVVLPSVLALATCNDGAPVASRLQGAHLTVGELSYPPFGMKNTSASGDAQWTGFDIDLFDAVASTMGFTYSITEATLHPFRFATALNLHIRCADHQTTY